jgi:hypothetical protein
VSLAGNFADDRVLEVTEQAVGPQWSFLLDGGAQTVGIGIRVQRQSAMAFGNSGSRGIQNLDGNGISVVGGSFVRCDGITSKDHTGRGISVSNGSFGRGSGMTVTGNGGRPIRVGSSSFDCQQADASNGAAPVFVSAGSVVNLANSTINNAGDISLQAENAIVNAAGISIDSSTSIAVESDGSVLCLPLASITGTDSHGIRPKASRFDVTGASITGSSGDDVHCRQGSIVQAGGTETSSSTGGEIAAADCNISLNAVNGEGIIMSETTE